jgi:hypothetical protein
MCSSLSKHILYTPIHSLTLHKFLLTPRDYTSINNSPTCADVATLLILLGLVGWTKLLLPPMQHCTGGFTLIKNENKKNQLDADLQPRSLLRHLWSNRDSNCSLPKGTSCWTGTRLIKTETVKTQRRTSHKFETLVCYKSTSTDTTINQLDSSKCLWWRYLSTNIMFLHITHRPVFIWNTVLYISIQRFGDWILPPSSGKTCSVWPNILMFCLSSRRWFVLCLAFIPYLGAGTRVRK